MRQQYCRPDFDAALLAKENEIDGWRKKVADKELAMEDLEAMMEQVHRDKHEDIEQKEKDLKKSVRECYACQKIKPPGDSSPDIPPRFCAQASLEISLH